MRTMKVLTVLGLLLAISMPASALTFDHAYNGPINMQYVFVGTSQNRDSDGKLIHMAIFKVTEVFETDGSGGIGASLWADGDGGAELTGIYHGLQDRVWHPGGLDVTLYGEELSFALYEFDSVDDVYTNAATGAGAAAVWDADAAGTFTGITDVGTLVLGGTGAGIIDPIPVEASLFDPLYDLAGGLVAEYNGSGDLVDGDGNDIDDAGFYDQMTKLDIDFDEVDGLWNDFDDVGDPLDVWYEGQSVSYLNWDSGEFYDTLVTNNQISFGGKGEAHNVQIGDRTSNGVAVQLFVPYTGDAGWEITSAGHAGALDTEVIPEPLTMIALFGGVAGLGGYIRKRHMA